MFGYEEGRLRERGTHDRALQDAEAVTQRKDFNRQLPPRSEEGQASENQRTQDVEHGRTAWVGPGGTSMISPWSEFPGGTVHDACQFARNGYGGDELAASLPEPLAESPITRPLSAPDASPGGSALWAVYGQGKSPVAQNLDVVRLRRAVNRVA